MSAPVHGLHTRATAELRNGCAAFANACQVLGSQGVGARFFVQTGGAWGPSSDLSHDAQYQNCDDKIGYREAASDHGMRTGPPSRTRLQSVLVFFVSLVCFVANTRRYAIDVLLMTSLEPYSALGRRAMMER